MIKIKEKEWVYIEKASSKVNIDDFSLESVYGSLFIEHSDSVCNFFSNIYEELELILSIPPLTPQERYGREISEKEYLEAFIDGLKELDKLNNP